MTGLPSVKINLENGNLGGVPLSQDGICGLVISGQTPSNGSLQEAKQLFSTLSDISLYLSSVPAFGGFLGKVTDPQRFMDGLKKTSSMEGWPAGIHGASLTDFKVPLSKLSSEVQAQIASHPLSWTPERMANMDETYLYEQLDILLEKEGIVYSDSDDGDSYFKGVIKILNSKGINADPKFVEAFTGMDTTWKQSQELQKVMTLVKS